ncbi:N/A [soil metagenome]
MNIALIGAGGIGTIHARAYQKLGLKLAAVADLRRETIDSQPDLFAGARYYPTYQELLADPAIDVIDICLINRLHAEVIRAAVAAGKHIFCEKTMAHDAATSAELFSLLQAYPKNFQVGYMKRFFPATLKALELLPQLGDILTTHIRSYQGFEFTTDMYDQPSWKPRPDGSPSQMRSFASGGMLNMAGSHMLDVMSQLVGPAQSVYAVNWAPPAYDAELSSNALFRMRNGSTTHFDVCLSPLSRAGLRQDGWDEKIEITGKLGRLEIFYVIWDQPQHHAPLLRYYSERTQSITDYTFPKVDPFALELNSFLQDCASGKKSTPGPLEGHTVDQLISACYQSAKSGQVVSID